MKLVPQAGLPLETLRAAGLKGKGGLTLVKNFATLVPGMADAFAIVRKHKPVAAFGVGGYAAGPMLLATWLRGIPNVIFEPNAEPGLRTKLSLASHANRHRLFRDCGTIRQQSRRSPAIPCAKNFFKSPPASRKNRFAF